MNRVWRLFLLVAMLCVALSATAMGATAKPPGKPTKSQPAKPKAGAAGQLDPSFGKGGKVTMAFPAGNTGSTGPKYELPFEFNPGHLQMAQAPGGKIVVAGAAKIVRYLANGKLDPSFGNGGIVSVPSPPGQVFVLASVAVDSYGRIVLAGLTRPLPTNSTPDPVLSQAALMRFNADGTPDTSFGNGGTLITDFGLGAPKAAGGHYPGVSVGLRAVVIDSQNRPVVSGGYVTELGECTRFVNSEGFVARLTESGTLDPSFGEAGVRKLSTIATIGQIAPRSGGYLALASGGPLCKEEKEPATLLTSFDGNGNLDTGFGSFGFRPLSFGQMPALSITPSGKFLLLGRPEKRHHDKKVTKKVEGKKVTKDVRVSYRVQTVERLLPSGAADPAFSRSGRTEYVDPKSGSLSALTADPKERVYLAGTISSRVSKSAHHSFARSTFFLGRTLPKGSVDRSFGNKGTVTTGFGGPSDSFATQVMLDSKGRILVGGGITSAELGSGGGFAIARYLPGS